MWLTNSKRTAIICLLLGVFSGGLVLQASSKCLICDSASDPNCIDNLPEIKETIFCNLSCYTRVATDGVISRGCFVDVGENVDPDAETKCVEPDCLKCAPENGVCNKHKICKTCNSNTNADCAQGDASATAYNTVCAAPDTQCVMRVRDDKHVERGCATAADTNVTCSDLCALCDTGNCNVGVFPADRRRCFQCSGSGTAGSKCADVSANEDIKPQPCLLYTKDGECYEYGSSETNMTRGCVTDADLSVNQCSAAADSGTKAAGDDNGDTPAEAVTCLRCATDNCNHVKYKHAQALTCVQCSIALEHENGDCKWSQTAEEAKNCANDLLYYQEEACYTQVHDGILYRGCLHDRNETALGACSAENSCNTCATTNGCNFEAVSNFTCIRCRDDEEPQCHNDADKLQGSECTHDIVDPTKGECYHGIWNGVVIRGCLVDADNRQQLMCNDKDNKQCVTCVGADCNTAKTSGAGMLRATSAALLLLALVALLRAC